MTRHRNGCRVIFSVSACKMSGSRFPSGGGELFRAAGAKQGAPGRAVEERRRTAGTRFLKTAACAALLDRAVRSTALLAACGSPRTGAGQHIGTPRTKSRVKAYGAFINREARFSEGAEKSALRDSFVLLLFAECGSLCIVHRSRLKTRKTDATASMTLISETTGPAMAATPSGGRIMVSSGAARGSSTRNP